MNDPTQKWHKRFLDLSFHVAQWSKDPSTKGYNGLPRGVVDDDSILNNKNIKLQMIKHAEENAILNSLLRPTSCTLYVTHHPCSSCAGSIVQSGISHVVYPTVIGDSAYKERWCESMDLAQRIFMEANIKVTEV